MSPLQLRKIARSLECFGKDPKPGTEECENCVVNLHCTKLWKANCFGQYRNSKICHMCPIEQRCINTEGRPIPHKQRICFGNSVCYGAQHLACNVCTASSECVIHIRSKMITRGRAKVTQPDCCGEADFYSNHATSCIKCNYRDACQDDQAAAGHREVKEVFKKKEAEAMGFHGYDPYSKAAYGSAAPMSDGLGTDDVRKLYERTQAMQTQTMRKEKKMSDKKEKSLWEGIRDIASKDIWPRLRHGAMLGAADAVSDETLVRAIRMGFGDLYKPLLNNKKWQPIILWAEPTVSAAVLYGGIRLLGWDNKVSELTAEGCLATLEIKAARVSAHFTRRLVTAAKELRKDGVPMPTAN